MGILWSYIDLEQSWTSLFAPVKFEHNSGDRILHFALKERVLGSNPFFLVIGMFMALFKGTPSFFELYLLLYTLFTIG
jgi:hypothetical protein